MKNVAEIVLLISSISPLNDANFASTLEVSFIVIFSLLSCLNGISSFELVKILYQYPPTFGCFISISNESLNDLLSAYYDSDNNYLIKIENESALKNIKEIIKNLNNDYIIDENLFNENIKSIDYYKFIFVKGDLQNSINNEKFIINLLADSYKN